MQKHRKSYKILQFLILGIGVHLRNLRIKWARNPFWTPSKYTPLACPAQPAPAGVFFIAERRKDDIALIDPQNNQEYEKAMCQSSVVRGA